MFSSYCLKGQCVSVKAIQVLITLHNYCDVLTHVQHVDLAPLKEHGGLFLAKKLFYAKW